MGPDGELQEPIDFDSVKIEYDRPAGIYKLTITGIKPHTNMEVSLAREEYARKPAFWWSAVVGCVKNFIAVPLATRYFLTVPLDPFVGTQGVEIVGASGSVRRKAPGPNVRPQTPCNAWPPRL